MVEKVDTSKTQAVRKRIIFVSTWHGVTSTGGVRYNREAINHLAKAGWHVEHCLIPADDRRGILARHWRSNWWLINDLLLRCGGGGIVILDAAFPTRIILPAVLVRVLRRGQIVTICHHLAQHDVEPLWWKRLIDWIVTSLLLHLSHQIITVSVATRDEIVRIGISPEQIKIVPDAVEIPTLVTRRAEVSDSQFRLLFVGTCYPRKGLTYLLEAISLLKDRYNVRLDIIGDTEHDPKYSSQLLRIVQERSLQDRVIFHGWVPQEMLWDFYAKADGFVLPSVWEGYGIVLLEALAFGLPIVATKAGAIPELISHRENGLLVPPADSSALAEAIAVLYDDADLRQRLAQAALERSRQSLSWSQVGEEFQEVIETLLTRS